MTEYLAFVDEIGRTVDGKYIYRFDFSPDKEIVWGEFFNVTPAAIIPNLEPDKNTISKSAKIIFPSEMAIARKSYCFSMQDCFDGIIPIIFSTINEDVLELDDKPFYLMYGEDMDIVTEKIKRLGLEFFDVEELEHDDTAIDNLINILDEYSGDIDDYGEV